MAEFPTQVKTQFIDFLRRLSAGQKLALGGVTLGAVIALVALVTVVNRPSYGTLFSNLAPQDASKIVEKLKEKQVPYRLEDDGKTVLIPKDNIYDIRLALAGEGLPQSSLVGYEIFDRTNLGVSDFVQKVNYRRALEGEIARTILQLEEVEGARVHIVVPERALFKEDERPTTASVVLKLRTGKALRHENVQGIIHLIASSVEGLEPSGVTVVDSRGRMLTDEQRENTLAAKTSTQYELQQKVENYLAQKAQNMLDGVVGSGNARVQVTAELDFRQVERTLEQYDPDRTVVRSEQITEEKNVLKDSVQPSTRSNTVTNYEVNKTLERVIENVGGIKRLSVAAIVNGSVTQKTQDGQTVAEYQARKPEEMSQLTEIVKRAVGFDEQRKDEVSVINLPFGSEPTDGFVFKNAPESEWKQVFHDDTYSKLLIIMAMVGAAVMLWLLLRRVRLLSTLPEAYLGTQINMTDDSSKASLPAAEHHLLPPAESLISTEAKLRAERRDRISEYISNKPKEAGRLLKVWLAEA